MRGRTAFLTLAWAVSVACTLGGGNATDAVLDAVAETARDDTVTATFRLDADPASVQAAFPGDPPLTARTARAITESRLSIAVDAADEFGRISGDVRFGVGSETWFEMRTLPRGLFVRIHTRPLLEIFGTEQAILNRLGGRPLPPELGIFASPDVEGRWVRVRGLDLFLPGLYQQVDQARRGVLRELEELLRRAADVEELSGEEGERYAVSTTTDAAYGFVADVLRGAGLPRRLLPSRSEIPEGRLEVVVATADGRLSEIVVDWAEIARSLGLDVPRGVRDVRSVVTLEDSAGDIAAPEPELSLNLRAAIRPLLDMLLGGGRGGGDG